MRDINNFLHEATRIIHVGADVGQETSLYAAHNLYVLWIEPNPSAFEILINKLVHFYRQTAYQALITDKDYESRDFFIASNGGSSSIFPMHLHTKVWSKPHYIKTITLRTITLPTLLINNGVSRSAFDAMVLDTQGSELLVLTGAISMLKYFKYIKVEVPDFEAYKGCCQIDDLATFMQNHNFVEHARQWFAGRSGIGNYYDTVYKNVATCATT